ncbi:ArsR/SmtB family transcription factor [Paenalcaligenes sp. Me52]|uniref:ArsR/SmtB family transcription factor n=1 Tax=Paenalcaligenes sp. Me52 TaxID=3392038 RepID=UPI003D2B8E10
MTITSQPTTQSSLGALADIARTLANEHRLALLALLHNEEWSVEQLAERSGLSIANTSQHLQNLKRADMVQTRRDGKYIYYRSSAGPVQAILSSLQQYLAFQHEQIQELLTDNQHQRERLDGLSVDELLVQIKADSVVLLDVRPDDEYRTGHIPDALHIPVPALQGRLHELPTNKTIVAYCRGPYCVLSSEAVQILHSNGLLATRLPAGYDAWQAAGLATAQTPTR